MDKEFWMVYREGGRAPAFKHADVVSASKEARRVARDSGDVTYVLCVVEVHRPNRKQSREEIRSHAMNNGVARNRGGVALGLWRLSGPNTLPFIG